MRSITIVAQSVGCLALSPARAGLADLGALRPRFSSAVSPESGSICRFNSSQSGTFQSSRSSGLRRRSRFAHLSKQPPYPSVRIDSDFAGLRSVGPSAAPESLDLLEFAVPILISESRNRPKCRTQSRWPTTPETDQKYEPGISTCLDGQ